MHEFGFILCLGRFPGLRVNASFWPSQILEIQWQR